MIQDIAYCNDNDFDCIADKYISVAAKTDRQGVYAFCRYSRDNIGMEAVKTKINKTQTVYIFSDNSELILCNNTVVISGMEYLIPKDINIC